MRDTVVIVYSSCIIYISETETEVMCVHVNELISIPYPDMYSFQLKLLIIFNKLKLNNQMID